jgi:transcriptional regulator with XRE-family HTH domain
MDQVTEANPVQCWLDQCPLKLWRESQPHPWARNQLARYLGCTRMSLSQWERGLNVPAAKYFSEITKLTKITIDEWLRWHYRRPTNNTQPQ